MIDTHCHIDQYDCPEAVVRDAEKKRIVTIAVTNLPSHYQLAVEHLRGRHYVRPALGLHPLLAKEHKRELPLFLKFVNDAQHIGEVGLDFSPAGVATRDVQLESFCTIIDALKGKQVFVTVHSRGAEPQVLECLSSGAVGPVCFHWFSGSLRMLRRVVDSGHFLSINPAMIKTKKWNECFSIIPRDRVLTETDGPLGMYKGRPTRPTDIQVVLEWIARQWNCTRENAEAIVQDTYGRLSARHGA